MAHTVAQAVHSTAAWAARNIVAQPDHRTVAWADSTVACPVDSIAARLMVAGSTAYRTAGQEADNTAARLIADSTPAQLVANRPAADADRAHRFVYLVSGGDSIQQPEESSKDWANEVESNTKPSRTPTIALIARHIFTLVTCLAYSVCIAI